MLYLDIIGCSFYCNKKIMKAFIICLALMTRLLSIAQNFEGVIVYTNTVKSKMAQVSNEQWTNMLGSKQSFYIKGNRYKSVTNGTMIQWQLYVAEDNKLYNKMGNSEVLLWNDASLQNEEILSSEIKLNAARILGYDCDELTLTCKSGVQKYYFTSKLVADCKLYEKHLYGNWYDFLKLAKGLSLKTIIENAQFTLEQTAIEVNAKKLDDAVFSIPADAKTSKSPY